MLICEVIGHVWATKKQEGMEGFKLMVVREVETNTHRGDTFVAADTVGAGVGEHVLVVDGSTARRALGGDDALDKVFLEGGIVPRFQHTRHDGDIGLFRRIGDGAERHPNGGGLQQRLFDALEPVAHFIQRAFQLVFTRRDGFRFILFAYR